MSLYTWNLDFLNEKRDISLVEKLMCYHQLAMVAMVVIVSCHDYCACEILMMSNVIIGGK